MQLHEQTSSLFSLNIMSDVKNITKQQCFFPRDKNKLTIKEKEKDLNVL